MLYSSIRLEFEELTNNKRNTSILYKYERIKHRQPG